MDKTIWNQSDSYKKAPVFRPGLSIIYESSTKSVLPYGLANPETVVRNGIAIFSDKFKLTNVTICQPMQLQLLQKVLSHKVREVIPERFL